MRRRLVAFVLLAALLGARPASAQERDWSKIEVKTEALRGNVSVLFGSGGNIGVLVAPDGVLLIDDQFAPLTPKILAAVKALSNAPIRLVLNTHWHGDHVGGNENLGKAGAVIVAQDNVRKRMAEGMDTPNRKAAPAPGAALPIVTFTKDETIHLGGETVRALHVENAHTDGDVIVRFEKANVVHMGDTFFNGRYPIIDLDSGGSIDGMIAAVDRAQSWIDDQTKVVPGHGPVSDLAGLKEYRAMLAGIRDAIGAQVKAKKTLAEIQASKPTQPYDAKYGAGDTKPDRFVEVVYNDLSRAAR
jgi:cyclase